MNVKNKLMTFRYLQKTFFFVVSLLRYLGLVRIDRQNKLMRLAKNH